MDEPDLDRIIEEYNRANELLTPHLEQRLHTYSRHAEVAIIQSWRNTRYLVDKIYALEEALKEQES